MRKCPNCQFLLPPNAATCKFCGNLLGLDPRATHAAAAPAPARAHAAAPEPAAVGGGMAFGTMQAAPVVRRADERPGAKFDAPLSDLHEAQRIVAPADHGLPYAPESSRGVRVVIAALVGLVAVIGGGFAYTRLTDEATKPIAAAADDRVPLRWQRIGPPNIPFVAELPAAPQSMQLVPIDGISAVAAETTIDGGWFSVGTFELNPGIVTADVDQMLNALASGVAKQRQAELVDIKVSDRLAVRIVDATLKTGDRQGWIQVIMENNQVYFTAALASGEAGDAHNVFDRIANSITPA